MAAYKERTKSLKGKRNSGARKEVKDEVAKKLKQLILQMPTSAKKSLSDLKSLLQKIKGLKW
jgi:hypothetical protein